MTAPVWDTAFWREAKHRWYYAYGDAKKPTQRVVPPAVASSKRDKQKALDWGRAEVARDAAPKDRAPTIRELSTKWLGLLDERVAAGTLKGATRDDCRSHLDTWILPAFGDAEACKVDVGSIRRWVRDIQRKRAASTVRNRLYTLRSLLKDAIAEGWIPEQPNPCESPGVEAETPKLPRYRAVTIRVDQGAALLACDDVPPVRRLRQALAMLAGLEDPPRLRRQPCDAGPSARRRLPLARPAVRAAHLRASQGARPVPGPSARPCSSNDRPRDRADPR